MRRLGSSLAALLLGGAAVVGAPAAATAAACPAGTGVTVVVGSSVSCDADGGGPATNNFRDAGHTLTPVDRQPGFVCKVDGLPSGISCVNTPPADAYWGLFWSDGTSGSWIYSSQGVGSLRVPTGGWVAFVFQDSSGRTNPSMTPVTRASTPAPGAQPTATAPSRPAAKARPSAAPRTTTRAPAPARTTPRPSDAGRSPVAAPATPSPTGTPGSSPVPTATATASAPSGATTDDPDAPITPGPGEEVAVEVSGDSDGPGPLGWVAGALVVALLGTVALVTLRRRTSGGPS